jgi:hypothetical protein
MVSSTDQVRGIRLAAALATLLPVKEWHVSRENSELSLTFHYRTPDMVWSIHPLVALELGAS